MNRATQHWVVALLWIGTAWFAWKALAPPPELGPPHAPWVCAHPVEEEGRGVHCDDAFARGLPAGVRLRKDGTVDLMAAERRLVLGVGLDLNRAGPEELAALPGVGPQLARRIVAGRPYLRVDEIARVRGVGRRLASRLAPSLRVANAVEEGR